MTKTKLTPLHKQLRKEVRTQCKNAWELQRYLENVIMMTCEDEDLTATQLTAGAVALEYPVRLHSAMVRLADAFEE